ncbi:MAG: hypothetical protein SFV55_12480 [Haliscomenobacter sp.]|uniref:hypothetical protein n=1 Tax=Haliscomenobacter sp. TaxID=2717303 RepID=UPI0029BABDC9|nr:hypothetical protein [Haliscomenobacter sp.]MDX2069232.1 hypothetical protein [Haliscomenobacter sp.]
MILKEDKLEFDFDDQAWSQVIKFDKHPDYEKIKDEVPETRGVDFTGILNEDTFVAIEVKDFRGFKTHENKREEPLDIEVAKKIVGTLATISASCRASVNYEIFWQTYLNLIQDRQKSVYVILWKEEDPLPSRQKRLAAKRSVQWQKLKERLSWLGCKTLITNSNDYNPNKLKLKVK